MSDKPELLPCPFCGEIPVITKHFREEMYSFMHRCSVVGPISRDFRERDQDHVDMWNTRVAPAEDVRAVVDEPVACYVATDDLTAIQDGSKMWATAWASDSAMNPSRSLSEPLYRRPQRLVVMPDRAKWFDDLSDNLKSESDGWNACLDEFARLNK